MLRFPSLVVIAALVAQEALAFCPAPGELQVMFDANIFRCAQMYTEISCGGEMRAKHQYENHTVHSDVAYAYQSMVVRPGCSMEVWQGRDYTGPSITFGEGSHTTLGTANQQIRSYVCSCTYFPIDPCNPPEDRKVLIFSLEAPPGSGGLQIGYQAQIGTMFAPEIEIAITLGPGIRDAYERMFKDKMAPLGQSPNTGFDWLNSDGSYFGPVVNAGGVIYIPEGYRALGHQIEGECNANIAKTQILIDFERL